MWQILFCFVFAFSVYGEDSLFFYYDSNQIQVETVLSPYEQDSIIHSPKDSSTSSFSIHGEKSFRVDMSNQSNISQGLRLNVQGEVDSNFYLEARLSDQDRPLEAQNQSGTLKEFDQVYIRLAHKNGELQLGDIEPQFQIGNFGHWNPSMRGLGLKFYVNNFQSQLALGESKLTTARVSIQTQEGQQGGYVLTNAEGEIQKVKPSSETVWLDGEPLEAGIDYTLDYFEGTISFNGKRLIKQNQRVEVEYESWDNQQLYSYLGQSYLYDNSKVSVGVWDFQFNSKSDNSSGYNTTIVVTKENIDSLIKLNNTFYQQNDERYEFISPSQLAIGDTVYTPLFVNTTNGSYRTVGEIGEEYYEYVGVGEGNFQPETRVLTPSNQRWSGVAMSIDPNQWLYADMEIDHIQSEDPQSEFNPSNRYHIKIGNDRDNTIGNQNPIVLQMSRVYKEKEFRVFQPTVTTYDLWNDWRIVQNSEADELSLNEAFLYLNPTKSWQHSLGFKNIVISDSVDILRGQRWQSQSLMHSSWIDLKLNEYGLSHFPIASDSMLYQENGFSMVTDFRFTNWRPGFGLDIKRRESDSLFWDEEASAKITHLIDSNQSALYSQSLNVKLQRISQGEFDDRQDSLKSVELSHDLNYHNSYGYAFNEISRVRRNIISWDNNQTNLFWNSQIQQSLWNSKSIVEGEASYEVESTQDNYLIPLYQKVPDGTGDVLYDSLVNKYIHDVDRGNLKLLGWGQDSNANNLNLRKVRTSLHLRSPLRNLLKVTKGFLAYSRLGFQMDIYTSDSLSQYRWAPSISPDKFENLYEASFERALYYDLSKDKNKWEVEVSQLDSKSNGFSGGIFSNQTYESNMRYYLLENLSISLGLEKKYQALQDFGSWKYQQVEPSFEIEYPSFFFYSPLIVFKNGEYANQGSEISKFNNLNLGLQVRYQNPSIGISNLQVKRVFNSAGDFPYDLSGGYDAGQSYEVKTYSSINLSKWFLIDVDYLFVWHESNRSWQRLMLSAKAVF